MRQLFLAAVLVCAAGLLAGCQGTLPGKRASDVTPNAITGGEIEVIALDAPSPDAKADAAAAAKPEATGKAAPQSDPNADPAKEQGEPAHASTDPAPADPASADPTSASPQATAPEVAVPLAAAKSDLQLACEKKRGIWSKVGKGELFACVYQTRDSGKRCERESQCEGVCLARSGTCSPFKPLFGCNEIFQDDGQRVTLCID